MWEIEYYIKSYWQSPYTTPGTCTYFYEKCSGDICFVRLDFDRFQVA